MHNTLIRTQVGEAYVEGKGTDEATFEEAPPRADDRRRKCRAADAVESAELPTFAGDPPNRTIVSYGACHLEGIRSTKNSKILRCREDPRRQDARAVSCAALISALTDSGRG